MNSLEEKKTIMEQQHKDWTHHPVTVMLARTLDTHLQDFLIPRLASNLSDEELRFLSAQIKQTKTIKDFVTNTEAFVSKQLETNK